MKRILLWLVLIAPLAWLVGVPPCDAASRVQKALRVQERLVRRDPGNAELLNDLGNLHLAVGDYSAAEASYRGALEIEPELVSARFNLALLLQQRGHPVKARHAYRRVLKAEPTHVWARYQLGILYAQRGSRERAIENFAVALRHDRRLTDPAYNPHILDNSLAASATLRAYADLTSVDLVPRVYEAPRRIVEVLVPELEEGDKPAPQEPLKQESERKKRRREKRDRAAPAEESTDGGAAN